MNSIIRLQKFFANEYSIPLIYHRKNVSIYLIVVENTQIIMKFYF